ncbi:MAG: DUF4118 domain-containing protein [Faecousia sp.]
MKNVNHEHILVCLSSAPSNGNIIRTAAKMSAAFGGTLTALYVQTKGSDQMGDDDRQRLQRHTRLAESLGANIATVAGDDVAYQIAEFARLSKVTKIVIGRSIGARGRLSVTKPVTEKLIELAPYLDIYIIPDIAGENRGRRNPAIRQQVMPAYRDVVITLAVLLLSTLIGFLFHRLHFTEANTITIYILGVLLTALFTKNNLCSGICSLASVLLFNFFFTEPRLSFYAYESGYPVTFIIMLAAALITGTLANRLADQAKQSSQAAWRTKVLLETNQSLQQAANEEAILQVIGAQLMKLLNRPLVIYPAVGEAPMLFSSDEQDSRFSGEPELAQWVFQNRKRAGASTDHGSEAQGLYLAIRSNADAYGVVGIAVREQPLEPFENSILLSILGEAALAMESRRNAREKEETAILAKNEQLRANLLRSISHDLRTPLTSVSGNAENMLAHEESMDLPERKRILQDIYEDAEWLIRLVENLLAITKIGEDRTRLHCSAELVEDVIFESLRHVRHSQDHILETHLEEELLLANMDARLISQVIVNLVDNALKYTPPGSTVRISACRQGSQIAVSVADNGPGIPDHLKDRVFDLFFSGDTQVADCRRSMGLGLALCKSIVTIHGGSITLSDHSPSGCIFTFTLPASEVTINE